MSKDQVTDEGVTNFTLQTGCDSFVSRKKDVFASLEVLEEKHSAFLKAKVLGNNDLGLMKDDPEEEDETSASVSKERLNREYRSRLGKTRDSDFEPRSNSRSPNRGSIQKFDQDFQVNQSAVFKKPNRMPRQPYVPDFKKHPERYTCYTLSDVSEKDMSEKSNTTSALAFLEEQRINRENRERELLGLSETEAAFDTTESACSQGKITFSKPRSKREPAGHGEQTSHKETLVLSKGMPVAVADADGEADQHSEVKGDKKMDVGDTGFKSRKNVRRQIRKGDNSEDSD